MSHVGAAASSGAESIPQGELAPKASARGVRVRETPLGIASQEKPPFNATIHVSEQRLMFHSVQPAANKALLVSTRENLHRTHTVCFFAASKVEHVITESRTLGSAGQT